MMSLVSCRLIAAQAFPHTAVAGACPWREVIGERLLDQRVEPFSYTNITVERVWAALADHDAVPLSFIEADVKARISLDLREATVRQVLDAVVAQAPAYRYGVITGRLVLFPRDSKWMIRLDGFRLGPAPRFEVATDLSRELSQRAPTLGGLSPPAYLVMGTVPLAYRDVVTVAAPGTVIELLVQLLGERPSVVFSLGRDPWGHQSLDLSSVDLLPSFLLTAPRTTLRDRADTVQLKVLARLRGVGERLDLTAAGCGTTYSSSNEKVVVVSADGLVSVRGSGSAVVSARNENALSALPFTVTLSETPAPPQ